jgi:hypothetical protein
MTIRQRQRTDLALAEPDLLPKNPNLNSLGLTE